jgi:hypothetical protein
MAHDLSCSRAGAPAPASQPPPVDTQAVLDEAVRAYAGDLDVSLRRLRTVLALLAGEIDRLGLPLGTARDMVAHSSKRRA